MTLSAVATVTTNTRTTSKNLQALKIEVLSSRLSSLEGLCLITREARRRFVLFSFKLCVFQGKLGVAGGDTLCFLILQWVPPLLSVRGKGRLPGESVPSCVGLVSELPPMSKLTSPSVTVPMVLM